MKIVEKNGSLHPAGHWRRGDIVGIRRLFTGESHEAHVEAETDMQLWVISNIKSAIYPKTTRIFSPWKLKSWRVSLIQNDLWPTGKSANL